MTQAATPRDANRVPLIGKGAVVSKTITLDGTANNGLAASVISLFTVTGDVVVAIFAKCTEDLASAGGGTLEIGIAEIQPL